MRVDSLLSRADVFAAQVHRDQTRKYTGEPYVEHCRSVAAIVSQHTSDEEVIAAALLHDTLEDTPTTHGDLERIFGKRVADLVLEVTDVSRPEDGNRATRKERDRQHLLLSSREGATIKLADLMDNTSSIVQHDPKFARVYLHEKRAVLEVLRHGPAGLFSDAEAMLGAAEEDLGHAKP